VALAGNKNLKLFKYVAVDAILSDDKLGPIRLRWYRF